MNTYSDALSYIPCKDDFDVLRSGYSFIKKNVEPLHMEDALIQNQVINTDVAEEIRHKESRSKRFDHLFIHIMRSGSQEVPQAFLSCLFKQFPHVKSKLKSTFNERKLYEAPRSFYEEAKHRFLRSKTTIINSLVPGDVLEACMESFIFTIDDFELICEPATRKKKATIFFDILMQYIPESFFAFLDIIKGMEKYKDIVQSLESAETGVIEQETLRQPVNVFNIASRSYDTVGGSNRYQMNLTFDGPNIQELEMLQMEFLKLIASNQKGSIQCLSSSIVDSESGSIRLLLQLEQESSGVSMNHYINTFNTEHFLQVILENELEHVRVSSGKMRIQVTVEMEQGKGTISDETDISKRESQRSVIQDNWKDLTEELEPLHIIPLMGETAAELSVDTQMQQIQSRKERALLFLKRLDEVGHAAIQTFIGVLDTEYWRNLQRCLLPSSYDIHAVRQNLIDHFPHIVDEMEPMELLERLTERLCLSQRLRTEMQNVDVPREERVITLLVAILRSGDDCLATFVDSIRYCRENDVFNILTSRAKNFHEKLKDRRLKKQRERFSLYGLRKSFEDTEIGHMKRELTTIYAEVLRTLNELEENTKTTQMPQENAKIYEGEFIVVVGVGSIEELDEKSLVNEVGKWKTILEDIKPAE